MDLDKLYSTYFTVLSLLAFANGGNCGVDVQQLKARLPQCETSTFMCFHSNCVKYSFYPNRIDVFSEAHKKMLHYLLLKSTFFLYTAGGKLEEGSVTCYILHKVCCHSIQVLFVFWGGIKGMAMVVIIS